MQRQVTEIICLTRTNFNFHLLDASAISRDNSNTTIEILLRVKVLWVFKRMARKAEIPNAVEAKDYISASRPITPHHISTLTEKLNAQWHHIVVVSVTLPVVEIFDMNEAIFLHRIDDWF